jgi:hypothetical protein
LGGKRGQGGKNTPNYSRENIRVSKWGGKVARSKIVRHNFGGKISCLKVGPESGRAANSMPMFWREMLCLKVRRESGLVEKGTPKFWRENVLSQSMAETWSGREQYSILVAGKRRLHDLTLREISFSLPQYPLKNSPGPKEPSSASETGMEVRPRQKSARIFSSRFSSLFMSRRVCYITYFHTPSRPIVLNITYHSM